MIPDEQIAAADAMRALVCGDAHLAATAKLRAERDAAVADASIAQGAYDEAVKCLEAAETHRDAAVAEGERLRGQIESALESWDNNAHNEVRYVLLAALTKEQHD